MQVHHHVRRRSEARGARAPRVRARVEGARRHRADGKALHHLSRRRQDVRTIKDDHLHNVRRAHARRELRDGVRVDGAPAGCSLAGEAVARAREEAARPAHWEGLRRVRPKLVEGSTCAERVDNAYPALWVHLDERLACPSGPQVRLRARVVGARVAAALGATVHVSVAHSPSRSRRRRSTWRRCRRHVAALLGGRVGHALYKIPALVIAVAVAAIVAAARRARRSGLRMDAHLIPRHVAHDTPAREPGELHARHAHVLVLDGRQPVGACELHRARRVHVALETGACEVGAQRDFEGEGTRTRQAHAAATKLRVQCGGVCEHKARLGGIGHAAQPRCAIHPPSAHFILLDLVPVVAIRILAAKLIIRVLFEAGILCIRVRVAHGRPRRGTAKVAVPSAHAEEGPRRKVDAERVTVA